MSSDDFAIRVRDVTKHFLMYARPEDRLKQSIVPRLQRLAGRQPTRYFTDFQALRGVSFDVRRGETVGIVGRNGSGKSTLLQIVCGTLPASAGTVEVNGRIAALLELGAGFNPEFSGRENVYMNAAILGLDRDEIDERFDRIASFADIGQFIEHPVKTYSSGMYVRLAFAVAINVDPDILVVDEALSVGDEAFQRKCFARIEQIKENGATILFVSHGAQTIVQLCDRAILIDGGEKLLEGRPKTVVGQYQRLVNADKVREAAIRSALVQMLGVSLHSTDLVPNVDPCNAADSSPTTPPSYQDYFDRGLVTSPNEIEISDFATISDIRLETEKGTPVNHVTMGRRYAVRFSVTFMDSMENIAVSMAVRTVTGLKLFGASTHNVVKMTRSSARRGEKWSATFLFDCNLTPGVYFITGAVGRVTAGALTILHRIHDAAAFRVQYQPDIIATGFFDSNPVPMITVE